MAYGEGPLERSLASTSGSSVEWRGWADSASLWNGASIFVGTSAREAFGRSAVEAASAGLPIVISAEYGAAEFLVTDKDLRSVCIVDSSDA
ncbi:glycosyltransferase family 4 protein, partial [Leifsonia sp. SIMBA_070]|uniref:glycosyltransferase family 4 protein n=1 Tax=Leifsonia sp. SIMBA_070 TaxID=3085810 RepID=UPI00397E3779